MVDDIDVLLIFSVDLGAKNSSLTTPMFNGNLELWNRVRRRLTIGIRCGFSAF